GQTTSSVNMSPCLSRLTVLLGPPLGRPVVFRSTPPLKLGQPMLPGKRQPASTEAGRAKPITYSGKRLSDINRQLPTGGGEQQSPSTNWDACADLLVGQWDFQLGCGVDEHCRCPTLVEEIVRERLKPAAPESSHSTLGASNQSQDSIVEHM
ncbi:MAG: hypothetical protein L6R35_003760, partial [Caloplaca aegaea]